MAFSFNVFLALIAGFSIGCLATTLVTISIYTSQGKKLEERAENRRMVINAIGKLSAAVENAFAAYRMGTMNYESLQNMLASKVEEINTALSSNMEYLDSFYVKSIEKFIEDQRAFLMRGQTGIPVEPLSTERSASRTAVQAIEEEALPTPAVFEPAPPQEAVDIPPPPPEFMQPETTPPPQKSVEEVAFDVGGSAPKLEDTNKMPSDALAAFELGATTRLPLDAIKQFQQTEESQAAEDPAPAAPQDPPFESEAQTQILDRNVFDLPEPSLAPPEPFEDEQPVKGKPVFDSPLDEATQEFSLQDLTQSIQSRFDPLPKPENPPTQEDSPASKKKSKSDDSLITGEDVMDQMDNFFGFEE